MHYLAFIIIKTYFYFAVNTVSTSLFDVDASSQAQILFIILKYNTFVSIFFIFVDGILKCIYN